MFDWSEWTRALGAEIAAGPDEAGHEAYFQEARCARWRKFLIAKGVASGVDLHDLAEAWRAAAEATPHGQPIKARCKKALRRLAGSYENLR